MKCLNCKIPDEDCGNFGGACYIINKNKKASFICNTCLKKGVLSKNEHTGTIKKTNKLTKKDKLIYKIFYGSFVNYTKL